MGACAKLTTTLTPDEAYLVLEPYYVALQEIYVGFGLDRCKRTQLYCAPWIHDSARHFAACRDDGLAILVAPELGELPEETVIGILGHELGHATDFLYPGEFVLGAERLVGRRDREAGKPKQWARWVKSWEGRDDDVVEFTADGIAEYVTGARIGYLGPCKLQCFNRGEARPQGLR